MTNIPREYIPCYLKSIAVNLHYASQGVITQLYLLRLHATKHFKYTENSAQDPLAHCVHVNSKLVMDQSLFLPFLQSRVDIQREVLLWARRRDERVRQQLRGGGSRGRVDHQTVGQEVLKGAGPLARVLDSGGIVDGNEQQGTQGGLAQQRRLSISHFNEGNPQAPDVHLCAHQICHMCTCTCTGRTSCS